MIPYQFDECLNARKLIRACNEQGMCTPIPYPEELHGKKDWSMLPEIMSKDAALVTIDKTIVIENSAHIPEKNPGIIIIGLEQRFVPMTAKIAGELLSNFKKHFPTWNQQSWHNICLQISENGVQVSLTSRAKSSEFFSISYASDGFANELIDKIQSLNA